MDSRLGGNDPLAQRIRPPEILAQILHKNRDGIPGFLLRFHATEVIKVAATVKMTAQSFQRRCSVGRLYSYIRVSTDEQQGAMAQQERLVKAHADLLMAQHPELKPGAMFREMESAFSVPFRARPEGRTLWNLLTEGDHVVFARLDRGFRDLLDMEQSVRHWEARGITAHFLDIGLDTSTAAGRAMLQMLGVFAQFHSASLSERMRLSYKERLYYRGELPGNYGRILVKGPDGKAMMNRRTVAILRYAQWMRMKYRRRSRRRPDQWRSMAWDRILRRLRALLSVPKRRHWPKFLLYRRNLKSLLVDFRKFKYPCITGRWSAVALRYGICPVTWKLRDPPAETPRAAPAVPIRGSLIDDDQATSSCRPSGRWDFARQQHS